MTIEHFSPEPRAEWELRRRQLGYHLRRCLQRRRPPGAAPGVPLSWTDLTAVLRIAQGWSSPISFTPIQQKPEGPQSVSVLHLFATSDSLKSNPKAGEVRSVCELQSRSLCVCTVMRGQVDAALTALLTSLGPKNTLHRWKRKMLQLVLSPRYLTLFLWKDHI